MIRILSLAAALAVLPLSSALAADPDGPKAPAEAAIEEAAAAFEKRMESFGERAEAIAETPGLSEGEREMRIATLWAEYQPEIATFTASITAQAGQIAQAVLADIDVEALVSRRSTIPRFRPPSKPASPRGRGWSPTAPGPIRTPSRSAPTA